MKQYLRTYDKAPLNVRIELPMPGGPAALGRAVVSLEFATSIYLDFGADLAVVTLAVADFGKGSPQANIDAAISSAREAWAAAMKSTS
jgi:hypothetical protein